jgi:hypothetical protein
VLNTGERVRNKVLFTGERENTEVRVRNEVRVRVKTWGDSFSSICSNFE